jgi:hypothetical protein
MAGGPDWITLACYVSFALAVAAVLFLLFL